MARPSKDFENICLERMTIEEERGRGTMGRYGVSGVFMANKESGQNEWRPVQSLPDFEGIIPPMGRQFVCDAKHETSASVCLHKSHFTDRQLRHLYRRAELGAICFLLIHFAARQLKKRDDPAETWAFPVWRAHPFWLAFEEGEVSSISRDAARQFGVPVPWNAVEGGRKPRPDILAGVEGVAELFDAGTLARYPTVQPGKPRSPRKPAPVPADVDDDAVPAF